MKLVSKYQLAVNNGRGLWPPRRHRASTCRVCHHLSPQKMSPNLILHEAFGSGRM